MQKELQTKHLEISEISTEQMWNLLQSGCYYRTIPMTEYVELGAIILSYPTRLIHIHIGDLNNEMKIELNEILQQNGKADET